MRIRKRANVFEAGLIEETGQRSPIEVEEVLGHLERRPARSHRLSPRAAHVRGRDDDGSAGPDSLPEGRDERARIIDVLDDVGADDAVEGTITRQGVKPSRDDVEPASTRL